MEPDNELNLHSLEDMHFAPLDASVEGAFEEESTVARTANYRNESRDNDLPKVMNPSPFSIVSVDCNTSQYEYSVLLKAWLRARYTEVDLTFVQAIYQHQH
jgi:hypothetical protein